MPDPETKYRYQTALFATLNSNATDVSPNSFAEQNLEADDRDSFIQYLKVAEVPVQTFTKDVARIENQLKKRQVKFASGISVVGSPSAFDEHVQLKDVDQQIATVTIQDSIESLK